MYPPTVGSSTRSTTDSSKGTEPEVPGAAPAVAPGAAPARTRWTVTVTGPAAPAPSATRSSAVVIAARSASSTRRTRGRPSTSSGSCPSIRVSAPEHEVTTPSGSTSIVTTAAFWTTARNRASALCASSNRRRSVRSRRLSRTHPTANQGMGVPTSSTSRQPPGVRSRISIGAPTSLPWMLASETATRWRSSGCTNSRPDTPTVSSTLRPNNRSAAAFPHRITPAPSTTRTGSGRSRSILVRTRSPGSSPWRTGDPGRGSDIPDTSASWPLP